MSRGMSIPRMGSMPSTPLPIARRSVPPASSAIHGLRGRMLYITNKEYAPPLACQRCGRARVLIPCAPNASDLIEESLLHLSRSSDIIYLCKDCRLGVLEEMDELAVQYQHPWVPPGVFGMVSPKVKKCTPPRLWAGRIVRTCEGYSLPYSFFDGRLHTPDPTKVPVRLRSWPVDHPPFSVELQYLLLFERTSVDDPDTALSKAPLFSSP